MIFELSQVALGNRGGLSKSLTDKEWCQLYESSKKQSVVGVVFEGVKKLPKEYRPPLSVLYQWIGDSEQIKAQNQLLNEKSQEISKILADAGFSSCILKGQGNALIYPNPFCRMSGDIDIWILGRNDRKPLADKELRSEINQFVKKHCPHAFEQSHHIEFPIFKEVEVEVHYNPGNLLSPLANRLYQKWCNDMKVHIVESSMGFYVPSVGFNAVYQLAHIMAHFFIEGIGLRQFIDYYYVLKNLADNEISDVRGLLKKFGLMKFAKGVMWIENECLGLENKYLIVDPDERIGRVIMKEMIEGGNFGHHDERYKARSKGYLARGIADTYRLLKLARIFPEDALWKVWRKIENQKWKIKGS